MSPSTPAGSTWWRSRSASWPAMPRPAHRHLHAPRCRNRRLGETPQCRTRAYQLDVHNRKGSRQNGPCISEACRQIGQAAKSQNLCDEVLGERDDIIKRLHKSLAKDGATRAPIILGARSQSPWRTSHKPSDRARAYGAEYCQGVDCARRDDCAAAIKAMAPAMIAANS